jgi:uncharacterized protein (TIGR01777 family)
MRVLIAGGSGLIGSELALALLSDGHEPVILSRTPDVVRRRRAMWPFAYVGGDATVPGRWQEEVDGCDAVVNLAGHNVFADRWNVEIKRKLRDSRVKSAECLVAAITRARVRPKVYVQGTAIGYYGVRGDEEIDERSGSGTDFLAVLCRECEEVSERLEAEGVRRAVVRTGVVLAPGQGALRIMTPLFKLGPGVPIGSAGGFAARGKQWLSWIHIDDIVGIFRLALDHVGATGPLNGTAPEPVRNSEFAKTFSSVLRKPYTPWRVYLPFGPPDQFLRLMLGEVADMITTGQRVIPVKALALGYRFKYPQLEGALRAIVKPLPAVAEPTPPPRALGPHADH